MAEAGCELHEDLTALAVMWFLRVLLNLHKFLNLAGRADRYFRHQRPDAVVLVDYPGFNWWIARRAKAHGIPVFYYTPPQIWAWASWRAKKMRRFVDHVLCSLPFEETWFRERGCNATFVGHPYFDEVRRQKLDERFLERAAVAARPAGDDPARLAHARSGHRTCAGFCTRRSWCAAACPMCVLRLPASSRIRRSIAEEMATASGLSIDIYVGRTPELIHLAECCMAVSGSVSLELLYQAKPTVILYWISRVAYFVQSFFRHVKYITLVNLLSSPEPFGPDLTPYDPHQSDAQGVLFPEYLTCDDRSLSIATHIVEWLTDDTLRQTRVAALAELRSRVGHGGASRQAAEYIIRALDRPPEPPPRPHYEPGMLVASSGGWTG